MSGIKSIPAAALPPWVRERRQPTRAELAGKYLADGGPPPPAPSGERNDPGLTPTVYLPGYPRHD